MGPVMGPKLRFLFDYASPYSYVASVLLDRGALDADVSYEPIYLRGLELFSTGVPYSAAKLSYLMTDLKRICEHHQIELAPPASFPVNGLHALRGALVALGTPKFLAYHRAAFAAVWAKSQELSSADAVAQLAADIGFEPEEFLRSMADPGLKAQLKQRTDQAAERGVFGVPTFLVGDDLFWGHDRLDFVERALAKR